MLNLDLIMRRLGACNEPCFTLAELGSQENPLILLHILSYSRQRFMGPCPECGEMGEIVDGDVLCLEHGYIKANEEDLLLYQLNDSGIAATLSSRIGGSSARALGDGLWNVGNYHGQKLFYARRVTNDICSATHIDPSNALIFTVMPPDITNERWTNKVLTLQEVFTLTTTDLAIQWDILERAAPPLKKSPPKPPEKQAKQALRMLKWHLFIDDRIQRIQCSTAATAKARALLNKPQPRDFREWMANTYPKEKCVSERTLFSDLEELQKPSGTFYSQEVATLLAHWNSDFLYQYDRQRIHLVLTKQQATLKRDRRCSYNDNVCYQQ